MIAASTNNFPTQYYLQNLGFDVAIKTGTPQVDGRVQDSFFIGYAPAENPEIAFAGVIEGGEYFRNHHDSHNSESALVNAQQI